MSYKKGLTAALKKFLAASDDLKKFALNNKMSKAHVDYAQEIVAARARDLKRELSYEHSEITLELPDDGEDGDDGLETKKSNSTSTAPEGSKADEKTPVPDQSKPDSQTAQHRPGVIGRDIR